MECERWPKMAGGLCARASLLRKKSCAFPKISRSAKGGNGSRPPPPLRRCSLFVCLPFHTKRCRPTERSPRARSKQAAGRKLFAAWKRVGCVPSAWRKGRPTEKLLLESRLQKKLALTQRNPLQRDR